MTYARKKDVTHNPIAAEFKRLGYSVLDLSALGRNCPDMLVSKSERTTALVEVKSGYGKLSPGQEKFRNEWPGLVFVARTADDVASIDVHIRRLAA